LRKKNKQKVEQQKEVEQEKKQKEKEDALWVDEDKLNAAKEARRKEAEEKRLKALQRKNENKELEEKEKADLVKQYGSKGQMRVTKFEIEKQKEKEIVVKKKEEEKKKQEEVEPPLEENINQVIRDKNIELAEKGETDSVVEARSVDEAIGKLSTSDVDRNPEKRLKAAFTAYESINLPILRKENPSLKLSQVKELLWKQWQKAPENPLNQQ